jgi:hypothetical protein
MAVQPNDAVEMDVCSAVSVGPKRKLSQAGKSTNKSKRPGSTASTWARDYWRTDETSVNRRGGSQRRHLISICFSIRISITYWLHDHWPVDWLEVHVVKNRCSARFRAPVILGCVAWDLTGGIWSSDGMPFAKYVFTQ